MVGSKFMFSVDGRRHSTSEGFRSLFQDPGSRICLFGIVCTSDTSWVIIGFPETGITDEEGRRRVKRKNAQSNSNGKMGSGTPDNIGSEKRHTYWTL